MSYIRSTSNPEGLYIWSDGNTVEIANPKMNETYQIPKDIFNGLILKYRKKQDECKFKGATIRDVWELENNVNLPKIELAYNDWKITMWEVTWYYIIYSNKIIK
jgi:hypothetical protein